jgi:hypothetical protein
MPMLWIALSRHHEHRDHFTSSLLANTTSHHHHHFSHHHLFIHPHLSAIAEYVSVRLAPPPSPSSALPPSSFPFSPKLTAHRSCSSLAPITESTRHWRPPWDDTIWWWWWWKRKRNRKRRRRRRRRRITTMVMVGKKSNCSKQNKVNYLNPFTFFFHHSTHQIPTPQSSFSNPFSLFLFFSNSCFPL